MALIESCQLKAVNTSEAARLQLSDSLKCDQKQKYRVVAARYASTREPRYTPIEHAEESAKKDKKRGKGKNSSAGNLLGNSTAAGSLHLAATAGKLSQINDTRWEDLRELTAAVTAPVFAAAVANALRYDKPHCLSGESPAPDSSTRQTAHYVSWLPAPTSL